MSVATLREDSMTTSRRRTVELPCVADRAAGVPLTVQVVAQLRAAMSDGRLAPGERLPSTRGLAAALGVSRTVVTGAYTQLFAEGWIEGRHGSGTYVAGGAPGGAGLEPPVPAVDRRVAAVRGTPLPAAGDWPVPSGPGAGEIEMRPGIPWAQGIDPVAWRRAWRSAGTRAPSVAVDPRGIACLRAGLTGYLRRSRGIHTTPAEVLVTRGVAGSLSLIASALLRPGDLVGVEEPGYQAARAVFAAHGARPVGCRVDADGLVVDELPPGLRLVYTTPAHQYPLGGRLPVRRRQALIAWARATGALIIEDDYDGEFRYDVAPLPPLFGLDPEVVIYLGTTTKTLTPTLRVGWLAADRGLVPALADASAGLGDWAGEPAQRAVHTLIGTGDLERHIRRMRHTYARRRAVMADGLRGAGGRLLGDDAGMHMALVTGEDAALIAVAARERGVAVTTLERYFSGPARVNGLVLGYGGATAAEVARGCQVLREVLAASPAR